MFVRNRTANTSAPWTAAQDAILSDDGYAKAHKTISGWPDYTPTPLLSLPALAVEAGVKALFYKDEGGRFGLGSFKALGGAYAVAELVKIQGPDLTVCCATDGNHGRSVAWGAQMFGCQAVIFIHENVSDARKVAIESYGAEVKRTPGNYDASVRIAQQTASDEGWYVVSDTSYPGYMEVPKLVMQGYEVMAAEAFDALPATPTHIFLQTGVGGMAAAVAACAKRRWGDNRPTIILADPENAACWVESYRTCAPTAVESDLATIMAGLACGEVSLLAWEILKDHADGAMALPDVLAEDMMRKLASPSGNDPTIVAGESAVAGLAALMTAPPEVAITPDSFVLVFGTEAATDPDLYQKIVGGSSSTVAQSQV